MMALASAMMIFGIFFMRYDLVVVGQVVPVQYELGVNDYPGLLQLHAERARDPGRPRRHRSGRARSSCWARRSFDGHKSEAH